MSTVEEIKAAIVKLPPAEFLELASRIEAQREAAWERQMEAEISSGQFDKKWEQAQREIEARETTPPGSSLRPGATR